MGTSLFQEYRNELKRKGNQGIIVFGTISSANFRRIPFADVRGTKSIPRQVVACHPDLSLMEFSFIFIRCPPMSGLTRYHPLYACRAQLKSKVELAVVFVANLVAGRDNCPMLVSYVTLIYMPQRTSRNDDDTEQDDNTSNQAHPHLHILPPHLLSDPIGATSEALGGNCKVVCFVLKRIQSFASLRDFVDVFSHHTHGIVDLLRNKSAIARQHLRID